MLPHTSDTTSTFRLKTVFDLVFENRNIIYKADVVNDIIHHRLKVPMILQDVRILSLRRLLRKKDTSLLPIKGRVIRGTT
ncbi:ankyrin-like [Vaccinia virus]|uniref:Ankyrin-like n=1 Tax=Vaccinia virus TaxID=10245 RepID=H2DU16_VACCV|nr:ankyrin-like [Vaccinia virus]AEY73271.1 ankyrin-like [Vaccinia virus]